MQALEDFVGGNTQILVSFSSLLETKEKEQIECLLRLVGLSVFLRAG